MELFLKDIERYSSSLNDAELSRVKDFGIKCFKFFEESHGADIDFRLDNRTFEIEIVFDNNQITIKKASIFWEILRFTDGCEIRHNIEEPDLCSIVFEICYSEE